MSQYRSYFSRSNTILYNSTTNTARNPITELFFGRVNNLTNPIGYSRYIFDIDLTEIQAKIANSEISTGCSKSMSHTLRMTNTSSFDDFLNEKFSNGRRRATSFDLVLFRIPKSSGTTGTSQTWDAGVGYDYYEYQKQYDDDKSFSTRPSNWFKRTTINDWSQEGIYDNQNGNSISGLNFSGLTIVDTQHFENGNEDIAFDMTDEINGILTGGTTGTTGWGIAFYPDVENITGLTENYAVAFFTPHTQTFYEPFLETVYDDLIEDDRNKVYENKINKLYLYAYDGGQAISFDSPPTVSLVDTNNNLLSGFTGLSSCEISKGIYEVTFSGLSSSTTPCIYYDRWSNITIDGVSIGNVENQFVLNPLSNAYQIGTSTNEPPIYGFTFSGIKQDEKILDTDVRKVNVYIKKPYTVNETLSNIEAYYRIYVREGNTEVQVQDWTKINRTPDGYYFIFDTKDKIPNEYFIDMKVISDKETNTYKREIKFQVVDRK